MGAFIDERKRSYSGHELTVTSTKKAAKSMLSFAGEGATRREANRWQRQKPRQRAALRRTAPY